MRFAVPAVRLPRPAVAIALSLMLTGLIGAIAIGQLVPSGDAAGVAVRGGWRPVAWSPDGSTLLVRGPGYGLVDRTGRLAEVPGPVDVAEWLAAPPPRLAVVEVADGQQRLVVRNPAGGDEQELVSATTIGSFGITADGSGWAAVTNDGPVTGGTLATAPGSGQTPATTVAVARDGARIVFRTTADGTGEDGVLGVSDLRSGRLTLMTVVGLDEDAPLALSPRGDSVALVGRLAGQAGLVLVPLDPRGPPTLLVPETAPASPLWSPNGARLLVPRIASGAPALEIVAVDIAAGAAHVESLGPGGVAAWLDDTTAVIVDPAGDLVRAAPDGTRTSLQTGADPACPPAVAADGTIAYCGRDGTLRLLPGS